ncbi:hypothetical protein C8R42DRAFT_539867, partial [Lentinula raphanica]
GKTKTHAERRIGELLFPDSCWIDISTVQNRVHGKIASLTQSYRKHAKKLKITSNGKQKADENEDEEDLDVLAGDVHLKWYIGSDGPTDETPEKAKNLWASIIKKFPFFPRLHSL